MFKITRIELMPIQITHMLTAQNTRKQTSLRGIDAQADQSSARSCHAGTYIARIW